MQKITWSLLLIGALGAGSLAYASGSERCDDGSYRKSHQKGGSTEWKEERSQRESKRQEHHADRLGVGQCAMSEGGSRKSLEDAKASLENEGVMVQRMQARGGCYFVSGTDHRGFQLRGLIHPETLEPVQPDA